MNRSPTTTTTDGITHLQTTSVVIDNNNNISTPGDIFCNQTHSISDRRIKKIISNDDIDLIDINRLNQVKFYVNGTNNIRIGFIAQEVQQIFPECVSEIGDNGLLALDFDALAVIAISGVNTLTKRMEKMEKELIEIKKHLNI